MKKEILLRKIGTERKRLSGWAYFPAPKKTDVGKEIIVERPCQTWDGFLGYFVKDRKKEKTILAFYWAEVRKP